ncbi:MAG: hypothetical protein ACRDBQ_03875 [Shewanella sp.]|uniref:hypothetical protein n=1 Tax=Gammaproteobacteria TaxID=1236 RepID=UPI00136555E6|nr:MULTISPECIES: hypothetical protein [Gammaproteobacteria]MBW3794638.1 hypothetical protein [Plesiomonas shigelloides]MBW3794644.1 hypothetical protein [Plesiomonas shigelloides]MWD87365.1 hypothetical protein [Escherichia coli]HDS1213563.1 hypothetical protein [Shewanella algae]
MDMTVVRKGQWIQLSNSIDAYVLSVLSDTELLIGYMQNGIKPIKENVILDSGSWKFKSTGPSGGYLRGREADIVRRGKGFR